MRRFTLSRFVLLLLILWQAALPLPVRADPIKTSSHIFPLHFVSWIDKDLIIPRIALKANFAAYPNLPSYTQFLDATEDSPERAVARYVQTLSGGQGALTPQTLNAARVFYDEDEWRNKDDYIAYKIKSIYDVINRHTDVRLWHRYDTGKLSAITLAYISPSRVQPFTTIYLRKIGNSYFITDTNSTQTPEILTTALFQVITLNESHLVTSPNLTTVSQPNYPYHFPLNSFAPDANSAPPMEILFTGQPSNILIDENMVPADSTQAFVKHAIQTLRKGTLQDFLSLWTDYDRNGTFARNLALQSAPNSHYRPPSSIGRWDWNHTQARIVFTIDCEVESLVFLRTDKSEKLELLVIWKQAPDDYRLSESGKLSTNETAMPGNLRQPLFDSPAFQNYLNAQVDEFIKQNN